MQVKDYVLKPAPKNELEVVVMKAVTQVKEAKRIKDNQKFADYWNSNAVKVYQDLWKDIIFKHKFNQLEPIKKAAKKIGYSINETKYCPIIIKWKPLQIYHVTRGNNIIEFALKNNLDVKNGGILTNRPSLLISELKTCFSSSSF